MALYSSPSTLDTRSGLQLNRRRRGGGGVGQIERVDKEFREISRGAGSVSEGTVHHQMRLVLFVIIFIILIGRLVALELLRAPVERRVLIG